MTVQEQAPSAGGQPNIARACCTTAGSCDAHALSAHAPARQLSLLLLAAVNHAKLVHAPINADSHRPEPHHLEALAMVRWRSAAAVLCHHH